MVEFRTYYNDDACLNLQWAGASKLISNGQTHSYTWTQSAEYGTHRLWVDNARYHATGIDKSQLYIQWTGDTFYFTGDDGTHEYDRPIFQFNAFLGYDNAAATRGFHIYFSAQLIGDDSPLPYSLIDHPLWVQFLRNNVKPMEGQPLWLVDASHDRVYSPDQPLLPAEATVNGGWPNVETEDFAEPVFKAIYRCTSPQLCKLDWKTWSGLSQAPANANDAALILSENIILRYLLNRLTALMALGSDPYSRTQEQSFTLALCDLDDLCRRQNLQVTGTNAVSGSAQAIHRDGTSQPRFEATFSRQANFLQTVAHDGYRDYNYAAGVLTWRSVVTIAIDKTSAQDGFAVSVLKLSFANTDIDRSQLTRNDRDVAVTFGCLPREGTVTLDLPWSRYFTYDAASLDWDGNPAFRAFGAALWLYAAATPPARRG